MAVIGFVITDVVHRKNEEGSSRFVTGYWTGNSFSVDLEEAQIYADESEYRQVLESGDYDDPAVYEVHEKDGKRGLGDFFDMVHEYGKYGGK